MPDGKGFLLELAFAREEPHLIVQPHDALDAFAQRRVEGLAEVRVVKALVEQLMVRGERHDGIADLVHQPVGHGLDEAQVRGLDFQPVQCSLSLKSSAVSSAERGHGGIAVLKRRGC